MKPPIATILSWLGCLTLLFALRADAQQAGVRQPPHQVFVYHLHRVRVEDTSPAEYIWVIDNDDRESVAARSLASTRLRDWVSHRPSYSQIIWTPPRDFSLLKEMLKERAGRNPGQFRPTSGAADGEDDKAPEEGIDDFKRFCESRHVELYVRRINEF